MPLAIIEEKNAMDTMETKKFFAERCTHTFTKHYNYTHIFILSISQNHPPSARPVEGVKQVLLSDLRPCYTVPVFDREHRMKLKMSTSLQSVT